MRENRVTKMSQLEMIRKNFDKNERQIPTHHREAFWEIFSSRYRTGRYQVPKRIVKTYYTTLCLSPYRHVSPHFYLREFIYLPATALYEYYLIMLENNCIHVKYSVQKLGDY